MGIFKKKSSKKALREAHPPKILKQWNNYRLIVKEIPINETITTYSGPHPVTNFKQIGWRTQLVIEQKDTNAMKEPYFRPKSEENMYKSNFYQIHYDHSTDLMFDLFREMFDVKDED